MFFQNCIDAPGMAGKTSEISPHDAGAALFGSAVVGAGASIFGSEAAAGSGENAADLQMMQYSQSRKDSAPWRTIGERSLYDVANLYAVPTPFQTENFKKYGYSSPQAMANASRDQAMQQFRKSPDYQFRLIEGRKALDRGASARGKVLSGQQLKAVTQYGSDLAAGEFGNYVNRLSNLAGIGQTATQNTSALGANAAGNAGNALINAGNARASGYAGVANAANAGLSNYLFANQMSAPAPSYLSPAQYQSFNYSGV